MCVVHCRSCPWTLHVGDVDTDGVLNDAMNDVGVADLLGVKPSVLADASTATAMMFFQCPTGAQ